MQGLPRLTLKEMRFYKRISGKIMQQNPLGNTLESYFQALQNERRDPTGVKSAEVQLQSAIYAQVCVYHIYDSIFIQMQ